MNFRKFRTIRNLRKFRNLGKQRKFTKKKEFYSSLNLLDTFSKLVNEEDEEEDEEVRNKMLGSLEFLAIKKV